MLSDSPNNIKLGEFNKIIIKYKKEVKNMITAEFGSIRTGTLRTQDLMESFIWELRKVLKHRSRELTAIESRFNRAINGRYGDNDMYFYGNVGQFDLDSLFDMLNEHAPDFGYFGSHPGDGANFGFWLNEFFEYDYDGLKVGDLSEVDKSHIGYVLHINDHGNMSLYWKSARKLKELWSIV